MSCVPTVVYFLDPCTAACCMLLEPSTGECFDFGGAAEIHSWSSHEPCFPRSKAAQGFKPNIQSAKAAVEGKYSAACIRMIVLVFHVLWFLACKPTPPQVFWQERGHRLCSSTCSGPWVVEWLACNCLFVACCEGAG